MTSPLTIFAILVCLTLCRQANPNLNKNHSVQKTGLTDTSIISILHYDKSSYWIFTNAKQSVLTDNDYKLTEKLLRVCLDNFNTEQSQLFDKENSKHPEYGLKRKDFIVDLGNYKRQYIVVTNNKGQKEVWVNCFCDSFHINWKRDRVMVRDGGNCYFNLKINLTTKKYYDLMVNGEA
jgi:hypothetical protein